jgi:hypothetical protein
MTEFDKKGKMNELAQANGYANSADMMAEMWDTWGGDSAIEQDENGMFTYEGAEITDQQKGILDGLNKIRQEELDYNANEKASREEMASSIGNNKPKREANPEREKMAKDLSNSINR